MSTKIILLIFLMKSENLRALAKHLTDRTDKALDKTFAFPSIRTTLAIFTFPFRFMKMDKK